MTANIFMQQDQTFVFCKGSDTIRIMPQNYVLLRRRDSWDLWADMAAPLTAVVAASVAITRHDIKWGAGENLALHLNAAMPFYSSLHMMNAIEEMSVSNLGLKTRGV